MVSSTFPADFLTSSLFFVLLFLVLNISPLYCLEHDRTNHFVSGLGLTTTIFSPLEYFMNLKQTASVICNSFKTITICFVDTRCNKVKLLGLKLMMTFLEHVQSTTIQLVRSQSTEDEH